MAHTSYKRNKEMSANFSRCYPTPSLLQYAWPVAVVKSVADFKRSELSEYQGIGKACHGLASRQIRPLTTGHREALQSIFKYNETLQTHPRDITITRADGQRDVMLLSRILTFLYLTYPTISNKPATKPIRTRTRTKHLSEDFLKFQTFELEFK